MRGIEAIEYPPELPISGRRDDLLAAIRDHQVIVVAGETGSGKTTQLPKLCLELGRTSIAHTQPRRLAARTVAQRIADELKVPLGGPVGYAIRFSDRSSPDTLVRLMTACCWPRRAAIGSCAATTRSSSTRPTSAASTSTSSWVMSSGSSPNAPTCG
jgi:energy-coupling factor transporter ATP-binding protein EcfA2